MPTKRCFKCGKKKDLNLFYNHPQMADGHLNKCKHCTKLDVRTRYRDPVASIRIREYERTRNQQEHRKQSRKEYQRHRRDSQPGKYRCHCWVENAIRDGRIQRMPCEICGDPKSEAHHEDYRRPQHIRWLCFRHHREIVHGQTVIQLT